MRKAAAENDSAKSKLEEIGTGATGVGKRFIGVVPRATKSNTPKKAHKPYPQTYDDMISSAALLSPEAREMTLATIKLEEPPHVQVTSPSSVNSINSDVHEIKPPPFNKTGEKTKAA